MRIRRLAICTLLSLLSGEVCSSAEIRLASVKLERPAIQLFERCELTVQLDGMEAVKNPYDPDEIALEATFQPSRGRPIAVSGFYYQPFELVREQNRDVLKTAGEPVWKIRFTPRSPGVWSYEVKVVTPQGPQAPLRGTFEVAEFGRRGFLQLDPKLGMLRFEGGQPFLQIGENLCWPPSAQPLQAYDRWFSELAEQRANYIRVWMAPWFLRLETKETGMGRYDQARAWMLDYLLEQSRRKGLYWQLSVLDHGSFSRTQDPDWQNNPYNQQLGGMCRVPNEFVTNPQARALFQRLLRYLVSRWGYSPQLASWELFNEADLSEIRREDLVPWVAQMSEFLRARDVNRRPITISFHQTVPEAIGKLPAIDTIQMHLYDQRDFAELFCGPMIATLRRTFQKPVMIGEFGWLNEFVRRIDKDGVHFHDGLWSSVMGGAAGGALGWYWDSYIHPNQLQRHFRPLAMFWRGERFRSPPQRLELSLSDADLIGCGLGTSQRAYLWIKNRTHNLDQYLAYRCELAKQRLRETRGQPPQRVSYPPRVIHRATATVGGLARLGRYRVEWWDPYQGKVVATQVGKVRGGKLTVEVPDLPFDVAAKLIKL